MALLRNSLRSHENAYLEFNLLWLFHTLPNDGSHVTLLAPWWSKFAPTRDAGNFRFRSISTATKIRYRIEPLWNSHSYVLVTGAYNYLITSLKGATETDAFLLVLSIERKTMPYNVCRSLPVWDPSLCRLYPLRYHHLNHPSSTEVWLPNEHYP